MSYAKIASTHWTLTGPPKSRVQGTDDQYAFEFEHELGCPTQDSTQDCTCYVSRIRLIKTPVGRIIPTTEPDLSANVKFWRIQYEQVRRSNKVLSTLLIVSAATGITALVGFAVEAGLLG